MVVRWIEQPSPITLAPCWSQDARSPTLRRGRCSSEVPNESTEEELALALVPDQGPVQQFVANRRTHRSANASARGAPSTEEPHPCRVDPPQVGNFSDQNWGISVIAVACNERRSPMIV